MFRTEACEGRPPPVGKAANQPLLLCFSLHFLHVIPDWPLSSTETVGKRLPGLSGWLIYRQTQLAAYKLGSPTGPL